MHKSIATAALEFESYSVYLLTSNRNSKQRCYVLYMWVDKYMYK